MSSLVEVKYDEKMPRFLKAIHKELDLTTEKNSNPLSLTQRFVEKEKPDRPFFEEERPVIENSADFSTEELANFAEQTGGEFLAQKHSVEKVESNESGNKTPVTKTPTLKKSMPIKKSGKIMKKKSMEILAGKNCTLELCEKIAKLVKIERKSAKPFEKVRAVSTKLRMKNQ